MARSGESHVVLLTLQLLCLRDARGLQDTIASIEVAAAGVAWGIEIQLIPAGLSPAGLRQLALAAAWSSRVHWWQGSASGSAAVLNDAAQDAQGLWIWWLEPGDLLAPSALQQWYELACREPQALVIAAAGEHLDQWGGAHHHGVLPGHQPLQQLVDADLYCPGAVSWRRSGEVCLPPLPEHLEFCFRDAWLLTVLEEQRERLVTVEAVWAQTHTNSDWQQPGRCLGRVLEWTRELQRRWGEAPLAPLQRYALDLAHGEAQISAASSGLLELEGVFTAVQPLLSTGSWQRLQRRWGLNGAKRPWQEQLDWALRSGGLLELWCVDLLRNLLHPELLHLLNEQAVWGPRRLVERLVSEEWWSRYRLLRQDEALIDLLNQPLAGMPLIALLHWLHQGELQERFPLPEQLSDYGLWWREQASAAMAHMAFDAAGCILKEPVSAEDALMPEQRPFGVNLIGHAFEVFGIGEDVRMAALALGSAGVPFCVVNVPAHNGAAASDRSLEAHSLAPGDLGPFRFNLVCLAAPSHGAWIAREGLAQQRGRTTIVAWPWETQTWPMAWQCLIPLADAFWPSSTFTAKALEPFSTPPNRPLQVLPMAVHIDQPEQFRIPKRRHITRERWGLQPEAKLVLFVFDVKSSLQRKNPWGAIQAFQQAFPQDSPTNVQLVIKALRPGSANQAWEELQQQAAQDPRLKVIEADLERGDLLALMGACDVFLSLHRSEGFGRGIAEAGILGLQVVTSAWGGNVDFCQGENFHLVPCEPVQIEAGAYVQAEGHCWGEPDLTEASHQLLKAVNSARMPAKANPCLEALAISATGQRYRQGLELLSRGSIN